MRPKMNILVCDDREPSCNTHIERIREAISEDATVHGLPSAKLEQALKVLFESIETFLNDSTPPSPVGKTQFHDYDLIVLDNNLTHLNASGPRLTAESIAGYIRAFTNGKYIISINKNPGVDFDLRFLIGDYSTRADLALNETHLGNRALWTGNPSVADDGFIPWYWPRLNDIAERRQKQIDFVHERLDEQVFSSLGFNDERIGFLSYHAKGALSSKIGAAGGDDSSIKEVTFRDVLLQVDSLPIPVDRKYLHSMRENPEVSMIIARVVAAYIDHWFRRDVLGPQEALVDLPHLLMRLPFLLGSEGTDLSKWNDAILEKDPPYNLDEELYKKHLERTEFKHRMWNAGPSFWWPELKRNDALNADFLDAVKTDCADAVFCEDTSLFVDRSDSDRSDFVEFSAEFEGNWKHRYVRDISGKQYSPRTRLVV